MGRCITCIIQSENVSSLTPEKNPYQYLHLCIIRSALNQSQQKKCGWGFQKDIISAQIQSAFILSRCTFVCGSAQLIIEEFYIALLLLLKQSSMSRS
jgi:hypothetical protein